MSSRIKRFFKYAGIVTAGIVGGFAVTVGLFFFGMWFTFDIYLPWLSTVL